MHEITDGKTRSQCTNAMIQSRKLSVAFDLKARYELTTGTVVEVQRPVEGRIRIDKQPLPKDCESTTTEFSDFKAGDNCLYIGLAYDHWSGKMFMEFIGASSSLYYDYDQHGPGDTSLGEIFKVVSASNMKLDVI